MSADLHGVHTADRYGQVSDPCTRGDHAKCSGVVGGQRYIGTRRVRDEVTLTRCGCFGCSCSATNALEAVARTVRARAARAEASS